MARTTILKAILLALATTGGAPHGDQMSTDEMSAYVSQAVMVQGISGTEADFIEASRGDWVKGHATFTPGAFVLEYAPPLDRRVVGDATAVLVINTASHIARGTRTAASEYLPVMFLTNAIHATPRYGTRGGTLCFMYLDGAGTYFGIRLDVVTSHVTGLFAAGHHFGFSNFHPIPTARAAAYIAAAKIP